MSINWSLDAEPAPQILLLPPDAASLDEAHAAIELWEHYSGKTLDPTQRLTVEVMMAESSAGKWAAATTGREMPRQNGKGDEVEVVELWGLVQRAEAILHTVHDAVLLASQAQQRMLFILEQPDLRQRVKRKWQGTGQQMIEMRNGGTIWYRTRTGGGGRGVDDIDRIVVDEAQHATEEQLAAVAPTLLANRNPQMNALGTSGLAGRSDWWWGIRRRALGSDPGAFGYVGHTAERVTIDDSGCVVQSEVDVEDRDLWAAVNPSVKWGRGGGMEFLEEAARRMLPESFAREHLGVWDPPSDVLTRGPIDLEQWVALRHVESTRPDPVALAVSVSQDRQWAHIGLAGMRSDGRRHLQVAQSGRGTGWLPDAVARMKDDHGALAVAVNPSSPAGAVIPGLNAAGVEPLLLTGRDLGQATGLILDGIREGSVAHQGQQVLDISIEAARLRDSGGSQVWDHRRDVAPLEAVTLALFALSTGKHEPRSGVVW